MAVDINQTTSSVKQIQLERSRVWGSLGFGAGLSALGASIFGVDPTIVIFRASAGATGHHGKGPIAHGPDPKAQSLRNFLPEKEKDYFPDTVS
jgi:hypothetical protein